jgi:hypothetical protein
MITPPAVLMSHESGRTFRFELGRLEKEQTTILDPMESVHNSSTHGLKE